MTINNRSFWIQFSVSVFSSCGTFGVAVWTSAPTRQPSVEIQHWKGGRSCWMWSIHFYCAYVLCERGHSRCVIQSVWSAVKQCQCNQNCQPICNLKRKFAHQTIRIRRRRSRGIRRRSLPIRHDTWTWRQHMRAAEVIDRVRKMKTAEHLLIAGRDNPTEDYGPGILNCLGNVRFIFYNNVCKVSICHQRYWNEGHCGCAGRFKWCRQQWRRRQRESEVNAQRDERCT